MKRGNVLFTVLFCLVFLIGISSFVVAIADCSISVASCTAPFVAVGRIASDGHFNPDIAAQGSYMCCRDVSIGGGVPVFNYSADGHVSVNSTVSAFPNSLRLGFSKSCSIKNSCNIANNEICVVKVYNNTQYSADNSHVWDCGDATSGRYKVCCQYTEVCSDGVDNDFDGYIDCADSECYQSAINPTPAICTGSPLNSTTCVQLDRDPVTGDYVTTYNASCKGSDGLQYYCSYPHGSTSTGACCSSGKVAVYDVVTGWSCVDSANCGLTSINPAYPCAYDFDDARNNWLSNVYSGNANNWCISKIPSLYDPDYPSIEKSTGCCLMVKDGSVNYYTDNSSVKIFGTS